MPSGFRGPTCPAAGGPLAPCPVAYSASHGSHSRPARHHRSPAPLLRACRGRAAGRWCPARCAEGGAWRRAGPRSAGASRPMPARRRGPDVGRETCFLIDQLIRALYDFTTQHVYPARQPDRRRASGDGRGRRLWPRRAGALLRHRSAVPAALQADAAYRAGGRVHALSRCGISASRSARRRARSTSACARPRPI